MMIQLPPERGEQLRTFAQSRNIAVTEAIGVLLKNAGAADKVPGFELIPWVRNGGLSHYTLMFDGFTGHLAPESVGQLADMIERCADRAGLGGHKITMGIGGQVDAELEIARRRRHSITITGTKTATGATVIRTLTLDLARDLAGQLRRAVVEAA